jgi:acetoin utilization protein AcuB
MFAHDYMTREVLTCAPDDLVIDVRRRMQEAGIRHVPVVVRGKLVGLVSLNTLRDAAPSRATDLSIHEVHYLLSKMRIEDVMKKDVVTCGPDDHIEDIARLMQRKGIGCVPVVEAGRLAGILTNNDMFRILMRILGMEDAGVRITLEMPRDKADALVDLVRAVKGRGKVIKSLLSVESPHPGRQMVILHLDSSDMGAVVEDLKAQGLAIERVDRVE